MQKFPTFTTSQLNWKLTFGRNCTQEAIDVVCSTSSSLAPVQGSQLINNNPSPPSPPSPTVSTKATSDSRYCAICTPLGNECAGRLAVSSDWDKGDDNTRKKKMEQWEVSPDFAIIPPQALQPPKPCVTKYFDNMSSDPPIRFTLKEKESVALL